MSLSAAEGAGLADPGSFAPVSDGLESRDPLGFPGYVEALDEARAEDPGRESVLAGPATIGGTAVELALFDFSFLGGSMGEVAGERLARAMERAAVKNLPFVLRTTTGGARMQEGMVSLAQMAKVTVTRERLTSGACPFICVLGNPTTGGVFASLASLADVTVVERDSTIGFAGPRLVEHFTGHKIDDSSHTAQTALTSGLVDGIIDPSNIRDAVASLLHLLRPDDPHPTPPSPDERERPIGAWDAMEAARAPERPAAPDLVKAWREPFAALRGDRMGHDDPAFFCCLARPGGYRAVVVALDRHRAPTAGGYRKARRCFEVAQRLRLPLITLVDTSGADPSEPSEASGIASEIALTLDSLMRATVPTACVVTGEGGSGGAFALAVTDHVAIYRDATFSVISPESAAEILWRNVAQAREAADALDPTSQRLRSLGLADEVVDARLDGVTLEETITRWLATLDKAATSATNVVEKRQSRWRLDAQR